MEFIDNVLNKHKCSKRIIQPKTTVEHIENAIGFKIPSDYKQFLVRYQGFEKFFGPEYMALWDMDELIEMNQSYEIIELLPRSLGIGSNMGGELIALKYFGNQSYEIVLTPFICFHEKENQLQIGNSFTDFLIRLDNEEKWFR